MNFKRNIMITGGAGFIGSHVVRLFVNKYPDYRIINLDKLTYAGNLANLKDIEDRENYVFVKADMESKIRWAMASEKISREEAEKKIAEMDEKRSKIRDIYSVTECGDRVDYDLIITSSRFGIEGTAELIRSCMARA